MECSHKDLSRGLRLRTGRYFTFYLVCKKQWHDGGRRWQADPGAQARERTRLSRAEGGKR